MKLQLSLFYSKVITSNNSIFRRSLYILSRRRQQIQRWRAEPKSITIDFIFDFTQLLIYWSFNREPMNNVFSSFLETSYFFNTSTSVNITNEKCCSFHQLSFTRGLQYSCFNRYFFCKIKINTNSILIFLIYLINYLILNGKIYKICYQIYLCFYRSKIFSWFLIRVYSCSNL